MTTAVHQHWTACADGVARDIFSRPAAFAPFLERERCRGNRFFGIEQLGPAGPTVVIRDPYDGREREVLMFGSNAYLGLTCHPRVLAAARQALDTYGFGTGAVSLYAGTTALHRELERRLAAHYRCEEAILFPNGYAANVGVLAALLRPGDLVFSDLFNHASIADGCALSGATVLGYRHADAAQLARRLARHADAGGARLIVSDGVFSMDGDLAPLDRILSLAREQGARVMIDEAHALGVVGPQGRGTAAQFGCEGRVDITLGTLSKAPAAVGGFVAGSRELVEYLRYFARTYFFSTSLPAPVVGGLIAFFDLLEEEPQHHRRLWENIRFLTGALRAAGFDLGATASAIVPVMIGPEEPTQALLRDLLTEGIVANYVAFPAVPRNHARLRIGVQAGHSQAQLERLVETLVRLGRQHGIIGCGATR